MDQDNRIRLDGGRGTSAGYATLDEVFAAAKEGGIVIENGEDISDLVPKPLSHEATWARFNGSARKNAALARKPEDKAE